MEIEQFKTPPFSFFSKLYYIINGKVTLLINGKKYICKKNDVILIPANIKMDFVSISVDAKWYWIHFNILYKIKTIYTDYFYNLKRNFIIHIPENTALKYIEELHAHSHLKNPIDEFIVKCNLMQILRYYIAKNELSTTYDTNSDTLYVVNQYMIEHLRTGVSNSELANIANLNKNYFISWFKKRTGYSPIQYFNYRKIELARGMLDHSDRSVSEILETLGFMDSSYFSRLFKKYVGCSPTQYRRDSKK